MPKLTAIIPNYNHAPFLERRIRTVLDQTYRDIEVLFMDDASCDGSVQIFDRYANDPRVRTFYAARNSGSPFKQWNRGVRNANGDYIWIAESDDYADTRFLETLVPLLDANPGVGLAYCESWMVDGAGLVTGRFFESPDVRPLIDVRPWQHDFVADGVRECADHLTKMNTIPSTSAVVFRKSVYEQVGGAHESYRMAGDWVTWFELLMRSDVAFVAAPLNFWRQHAATVRSGLRRSGRDVEEIFHASVYFRQLLGPQAGDMTRSSELLEGFWYWRWRELFPWISVARTWRIYRMARQLNPGPARRFLRAVLRKRH